MKTSRKQLQLILVAGALILVFSLETLLLAKDAGLYRAALDAGRVDSFGTYLNVHMLQYAIHVFIPVLFGLYIFALGKRSSGIAKGVFTLFLVAGFLYRLIEFQIYSPLYYLSLLLYLILIILYLRPDESPVSEAKR